MMNIPISAKTLRKFGSRDVMAAYLNSALELASRLTEYGTLEALESKPYICGYSAGEYVTDIDISNEPEDPDECFEALFEIVKGIYDPDAVIKERRKERESSLRVIIMLRIQNWSSVENV